MNRFKSDDRINCVFATDNNYCQHLSVALVSVLENDKSSNLAIHIIHSNVSKANLALLSLTAANYPGVPVAFYEFDSSTYSHFRVEHTITLASYTRLFLADILPTDIKKLIYLDCDVVVLADLQPLWDLDLENNLIAAAPDLYMPDTSRLGLPDDYCYVNAGVLIIDLAGWRSNNLTPTFVEYVEKNSAILRYHDQDTLNGVFHHQIKYLDLGWNFQARFSPQDVVQIGLSHQEYLALRKGPKIVHFTTHHKPWSYRPEVAFEDRYLFYLQKTPWKNYTPPDRTMGNIIRRRIKRNLLWLVSALKAKSN